MSDEKNKLAKKILSRLEEKKPKTDDKIIIKGTDKIDTRQFADIKDSEEFAKRSQDRSNLNRIKLAAKKLIDRGKGDQAKSLLQKAMNTNAFKNIKESKAAEETASKIGEKVSSKVGKKLVKSIPLVGGIASAISSKDVSAAIPLLNEAEGLGPRKGSPEAQLEDPSVSAKERARIGELLKKKLMNDKSKK